MSEAALDPRMQALLDKQEIREVVLRYCRGVDRMDRELVRSCYHADATDEHGSFRGGVEAYLDFAWKLLPRYDATMHFVGNVLVELHGDQRALRGLLHRPPPQGGRRARPQPGHGLPLRG